MEGRFEQTDAGGNIAALLNRLIGLNETSIGSAGVQRAIAQAMQAAGYGNVEAYWQHLQGSQTAIAALIEAIVVPETSFFRNPESFAFLKRWANQTGRQQAAEAPLRLLSLPCSTGEEPYSIAMTLLEAGLSAEQFQVDALDVSAFALAQAECGVFSAYSFRPGQSVTTSLDAMVDRYFQPDGERYRLSDHVRSQVQFRPGNLADPMCLYQTQPYDVVFCRNLLIYFHQVARDRAMRTLHRLLQPSGLLFLGYAETNQIHPDQFESIRYPQAFVYRRVASPSAQSKRRSVANTVPTSALPLRPGLPVPPKLTPDVAKSLPVTPPIYPTLPSAIRPPRLPQPAAQISLRDIRSMADRGELPIAAAQCDRYLHTHPTSAAAYLLLGEIYQAQGINEAAMQAFRKAIYLDPTCVEALLYLALRYEDQGQLAAAERLRQRIQRLTVDD
ncbi:MAG: CheR family methyltransferase [Cyanobacteria bacterium P01_H01_bin.162]